ncbi:hypothetical protein P280DRAFT_471750 [Massarina eburnea CBS 473.64]|uniref:Uncharacterized protein n=1 Tax=Massarina eburnea CBS 473.64 TaxID=1395130 RepID=A0A6A6RR40_9PLEO|nr:hypothetical protein P280DRAFT_471750 [Massarina eburnea CBS 473.64]
MDKGVDKFDLRDDEFMMVEDELLQTAKLFTRHLHLAEYEKMKTEIEEKKSRNEKTPRPVVVGVKPSIEGQFKKKAHEQAKAQNTFFDAEDASEQEESSMRQAAMTNRTIPSTKTRVNNGSDSDDLDAPQPPTTTKYTAPLKPPPKQLSRPAESTAELPSSSFVKPALPALSNANARARARARAARMNRPSSLIDEWDGFKPNDTSPARRSSSPVKHAAEDSDRFAKRKAEKGKEARSKAQKMEADDIPTFMF